jgi:RNA polymerase sigma-70 factor (ECF subfamily)
MPLKPTVVSKPMRCVSDAWTRHEGELRHFLRHRATNHAEADDLLQDVFLRALRQTNGLCDIENPRAWLFHVARNLLIDRLRLTKEQIAIPDELAAEPATEIAPVDDLAQCLPRVLAELSPQDRDAITCCDIDGMSQREYAVRTGLTLPGAKSRLQRARARLKTRLTEVCQVSFDARGDVCCFVPRTESQK